MKGEVLDLCPPLSIVLKEAVAKKDIPNTSFLNMQRVLAAFNTTISHILSFLKIFPQELIHVIGKNVQNLSFFPCCIKIKYIIY